MADYEASGTENLRAFPTQRETSSPQAIPGSGKPAGGTENLRADGSVKHADGPSTPSGGSGPKPPQSFNDDAT